MINIKELEPKYIMDVYEHVRYEKKLSFKDTYSIILYQSNLGPTKCFVDENDLCIGIIGMYLVQEGVAYVWLYGTYNIEKNKIGFYRSILKLIKIYVKALGCHRVEFICRTDIPETYKLAESLGFTREGLKRQGDPDKNDYYYYARLF